MGFSASTDPELEFDREVYPIGISLAEVAVVGVPPLLSRPAACRHLSGFRLAHVVHGLDRSGLNPTALDPRSLS